ncbi:MAG: bifunctional enoyl-CoA hydratase/phosphate acetyltransferase, partial [Pseudomonadota bacterium]
MTYTNKPYDSLAVGDTAALTRICTEDDFLIFANTSGNHNPLHLASEDGDGDGEPEAVAPAMFVGALISAVLGNILPGAGTLYRAQTFAFAARAHAGDELIARVTVREKRADREVVLATEVTRKGDGALILSGEAVVVAPSQQMTFEEIDLPGLVVQRHRHFETLIARAAPMDPMPTAVVCPEDETSLSGALLAARRTIITPILVGHAGKIREAAEACGADLTGLELVDVAGHAEAAHAAVDLVANGRANALMKGHLHTDDLLRAALRKERGLRTGRRFTHVFVM